MNVREDAKGGWIADLRVNGKGPQIRCKYKKQARELVVEAESYQNKLVKLVPGKTLGEAAKAFIEYCERSEFSQNTIHWYKGVVELHVVRLLGATTLVQDIGVAELRRFRSEEHPTLGAASKDMPCQLLSGILDEAWSANWVIKNPFEDLPEVRRRLHYVRLRPNKRLRLPEPFEWQACMDRSTGPLHLIIALALLTGLRIGEILSLKWSDIRWDIQHLLVETTCLKSGPKARGRTGGPKTKTSKRLVPISNYLESLLLAHLQMSNASSDDFVVQVKGKPVGYHRALDWLHVLLQELGITRICLKTGKARPAYSWHAFRHACAARWVRTNVPVDKVSRWLGHAQLSTTLDTYCYLFLDRALADPAGEATTRGSIALSHAA